MLEPNKKKDFEKRRELRRHRGNTAAIGTAAALLLAVTLLSACGRNKSQPAEPAQQPTQGTVQDAIQTSPAQAEDMLAAPEDTDGLPESVMDVICAASGITAMPDGSLLVTDTYNKVVWKVLPHNGVSAVYAGGETVNDLYGEPVGGYNDADLEKSYFQCPWAIAPFLGGYAVSDADNNAVRLITKERVQTVNGKTTERLTVSKLGVVFEHPTGLAADEKGNLYVSDTFKGAVRRITPEGKVSTVKDGMESPMGLCWKDGALYVAETGANRVVKIADGKCVTVAGRGEGGYFDGDAAEARFNYPQGVAVGDDGTIYVADTGNSAIRMVKDGKVETLFSRDRTVLEMTTVSPTGLLVQGDNLYVCDNFTRKVLRISLR